jgi:hypothetical protein
VKYRFQAATAAPDSRVDREKRVIYGVSMLQAGEAMGHNMLVDEVMLKQCADAVNATGGHGMKSRFTHPGMCSDAMGKMLGKVKTARVMGDKCVADLHLAAHASKTPDGDLADYVMSMAEESPEDFGMSIAFDGSAVWKCPDGKEYQTCNENGDRAAKPADAISDKPFARISKLRASDIVDEPAANRDGLFAAFAGTTNLDAVEMFAALDQARDTMGWDNAKTADFLGRYLAARTDTQPRNTRMDPTKFAALLDAEPAHAAALGKLFAAGKSEAEITTALADMKAAAELSTLKADLAAAKAAGEKATADLTAEKAAHAKTSEKLAKFAKLGDTVDPGSTPAPVTPKTTDAAIKQAWEAMPAAEQAAFLGDFKIYEYHIKHDRGDKLAAKE